ncbi:MAG: hypothetical protein JXN61_12560 [Sedimentisphaerales bacterium]|nr:hypothetical protein [Sedimentisphaerales bacterium]
MSEIPEDTDMVVVYEASLASAGQVIELLAKEGIEAVVLNKTNPSALYVAHNVALVKIAVPREQAPWARSHLRKWDDACNANVGPLTKQLGICFLRSITITAVVAAGIYAAGLFTWNMVAPLVALWAVAFTLLAKFDGILKSGGKD